ncbi:hypothetical protein ACWATR_35920 [Nostoc sp. UIC 10890]
MCNAWNHSPSCNCGWGGGSYGSRGRVSTSLSNSIANEIKDAETYPTTCWWCGETVFYHTNGFGDSVLFDSLGSPWRVHSCWKNYWDKERFQRQDKKHSNTVENSVILRTLDGKQKKRLILAGAIQSVSKTQFCVTEEQVANRLGISLENLRAGYSHLYFYSGSLGASLFIRMKLD